MEIRPILSTLMRHKTAATLIVLQIAVTCAIICNAFFMIGERITQISEPSGLAEDELLRIQIIPVGDDAEAGPRTRTDLALLRGLPGVTAATVMNQVPFGNSSWNSGVRLTAEQQQSTLNATNYMAEEQFIQTLGLDLIAGRDFLPEEYVDFEEFQRNDELTSIPAAIITKTLADRLFPGENPIGKVFYSWGEAPIPVVGVVESLVRPSMQGGPSAREFTMVFPLRPNYNLAGNYMVRTSPERRAEVMAEATEALRGNGPPRILLEDNTTTVSELRDRFYQQQRGMAWLLGVVCVALLLITALGIVGLASFWVQQRTRQIGVRRALGATRGEILRYFQTENFLLAGIGIVLGMLAAYGINLWLMSAYELARLPLYYLPIGAAALWLLGQIAVFGPAQRAASVSPAVATRSV
jgi:putative ABC transport system permease protein